MMTLTDTHGTELQATTSKELGELLAELEQSAGAGGLLVDLTGSMVPDSDGPFPLTPAQQGPPPSRPGCSCTWQIGSWTMARASTGWKLPSRSPGLFLVPPI